MKKIKVIIAILFVLIFAYFYSHIEKTNNIYDKKIDTSQYMGTGVFNGTIQQSFISTEDKLDGISAKCQLQGDSTGTYVKMSLIDNEKNTVVATSQLNAEEIVNSKFNVFQFNTITNCKGKSYTVILEDKNVNLEDSKGIGFVYQTKTEDHTKLLINKKDIEGTLIIKTVTNRFDLETFCVLLIFIIYIVLFIKFLYKLFK